MTLGASRGVERAIVAGSEPAVLFDAPTTRARLVHRIVTLKVPFQFNRLARVSSAQRFLVCSTSETSAMPHTGEAMGQRWHHVLLGEFYLTVLSTPQVYP
jgi:hypothetical protein